MRHGHFGDQRTRLGGPDQAARGTVPDLDIWSQALVERISGGWQITSKGRTVLEFMEARSAANFHALSVEQTIVSSPTPVPPLRQPADRAKRRRERRERRRVARERARANAP